MIRLGITGTDTGVGKTVVACALTAALHARGLRVTAMKPIETGVAPDDPTRDGARLARAARDQRPLNITAPITLPDPVAPLAAARRSSVTIDLLRLDSAVDVAATGADALIVEGAGGLLVPITEGVAFADLFARWSLDLVVVAANRLGVINHVRLTCASACAAGLSVRAVVLNTVAGADDSSTRENADLIAELEDVSVIELPYFDRPDDFCMTAEIAERSGLVDLVAPATADSSSHA